MIDAAATASTPVASPWLTTEEAVAYCRLSRKLLYRAAARGELRHTRVGRAIRFKAAWLDQFMETMATGGRA